MKFSCQRMESLATGESCATQSVFEANALMHTSFIAKIKRTGYRSKHIGWLDLVLLDSERLAVCYPEDDPTAPARCLYFPLIKGSEFGEVRRHGNSITLHAVRYSLVLEAECQTAGTTEEDEGNLAVIAGKWSRTLNRLVSGETAESSGANLHYGGLGISVSASKPSGVVPLASASSVAVAASISPTGDRPRTRTKQLVQPPVAAHRLAAAAYTSPLSYSAAPHHSAIPQSATYVAGPGIPRSGSAGFTGATTTTAFQPRPINAAVQSMYAPQLAPVPDLTSSMPKSRSLKRISLHLGRGSDFGFGDDLKAVLTTLEDEETPEEEPDTTIEEKKNEIPLSDSRSDFPSALLPSSTFGVPQAPFSDDGQESGTPSPNSLYLASDASPSSPPLDFGSSPKRMASILAKEHQQYVEKYGSRAANLANFSKNSSIESLSSRQPPKIPAPMPKSPVEAADNQAATTKRTSTVRASLKSKKTLSVVAPAAAATAAIESKPSIVKKNTRRYHSRSDDSEDSSTGGASARKRETRNRSTSNRKTVSIDPTVQVIKDNASAVATTEEAEVEEEPSEKPAHQPAKHASAASPFRLSSPNLASPMTEQKTRFVKAMKRILGKKKSKSAPKAAASSPRQPHDEDDTTMAAAEVSSIASMKSPEESIAEEPESIKSFINIPGLDVMLHYGEEANHSRAKEDAKKPDEPEFSLDEEETTPTIKERSGLPTPESIDEEFGSNRHIYANLMASEEASPERKSADEPEPKPQPQQRLSVMAHSTNNSRTTAAVPSLNSSRSIAALSFRSLSSRSLASRASEENTTNTASEKTEKTEKTETEKPKPATTVSKRDEEKAGGSPTLLKRESRRDIEPVPVALESPPSPLLSSFYENGNKSTSALAPPKATVTTVSTSTPPPPHQKNPSVSSSYSSIASKRSISSYASSLSSASSFSTPTLVKSDLSLFSGHLWVSLWSVSRWKPFSQLELKTDILATDATHARINVGSVGLNVKFTSECEVRRVGNYDIEVKTVDDTYMFRCRDPEMALRFYKTLWTLKANGVQPVAAAALSASASWNTLKSTDEEDSLMLNRRKTLMPPSLSRSNQNLRYMGRSTETIMEE